MYLRTLVVMALSALTTQLHAQVTCDPSSAPDNLGSVYTSGSGASLSWDAVPGSVGVMISATLPSGSNVSRRLLGTEIDQYDVSDAVLTPGVYTWYVQAACSSTYPYDVTPVSIAASFTVTAPFVCPATVTDLDGNVYSTTAIGGQCWLAENLRSEHFEDGTPIPSGLNDFAWMNTSSAAFAYPAGDPSLTGQHGLIYNWFAVADMRNICPSGWHTSTDEDWAEMIAELGGLPPNNQPAGNDLKSSASDVPPWNGSNTSGFNGYPSYKRYSNGFYPSLGLYGDYWTSSEFGMTLGSVKRLDGSNSYVQEFGDTKQEGKPVRCLKD